jgi:hypothetical protein
VRGERKMQRSAAKVKKGMVWTVAAILIVFLAGAGRVSMAATSEGAAAPGDQIFHASGGLVPGESNAPSFPVYAARSVNLKLLVPAVTGAGAVDLAFFDGTETKTFEGQVLDGEVLWATVTIKPGYNEFHLQNVSGAGGPDLQYELWVYEVGQTPFSWSGESLGEGSWRSHIRLSFPDSGLYQFTFGTTSGRYQFLVDSDYIRKTAETTGSISYYVAAGVHDLYIMPDATPSLKTNWSLNVSGPGAAGDSLPYSKMGGNLGGTGNDFVNEWLPLKLASATKANFELTLIGEGTQGLNVYLYGAAGTVPVYTISEVHGGETVWWTTDLPAGVSRAQLATDAGNLTSLAYEFTVRAMPAFPASWSGISQGPGNNSQVRFEVSNAGLYDFDYDVAAGRYQFLVESDVAIQKTVESAGTVRYYLDAGTHELTVVQDTGQPATGWSLGIAATDTTYDTLPYHRMGGNLGGTGNEFVQEWLPLNAEAGGPANFELTLAGDPDDGLSVSLYQGDAKVYSTPVVYGGETFWWTADLAAGLNQIEVMAESNAGALEYDLTAHAVPSPPASWSGEAKGGAGHSVTQVSIPDNGTYTVTLDTPTGFSQVLIDGAESASDVNGMSQGQVTEFLVPFAAGNHSFEVVQAAAYPTTSWTVGVESAMAGNVVAHLTGALAAGEQVDPQVPLFGAQDKEVNFRLAVTGGGPLDLTIEDGLGGSAFAGSALSGEAVWGTAILRPGQNTFTLLNSGAAPLAYDLTVYEIGQAPYNWAGDSASAGDWESHIKLHFPSSGVYSLDFGVLSGRYQILVDGDYIQKTAEADGMVSYYVPAGDHLLTVVPDRTGADTSWMLDISAPGAASDALPYSRSGGDLWSTPAKFNEEWLPLNLTSPVPANFELTLAGSGGDAMAVHVYSGLAASEFYSITGVYGGETVWWTTDLPAGVSRIQLVADPGNTAPLAYTLTVHAQADVPAGWDGVSFGGGNNSQVRFEVSTAGLYDFDYDVAAGRYQFLVESDVAVQKTVESAGTVRYYLSAGTHELTVVQDSGQPATGWSLGIAATDMTYDTLPYHRMGGNLGGAGNEFVQEWLPLNAEAGGPANFELTLDGDLGDGLVVSLYRGGTEVYSTPVVYGGETFWWTAPLPAGLNQLKLQAGAGNTGYLEYDLTVHAAPMVAYNAPYTWSGVSKGPVPVGHSEIEVQAPVSGTYLVALDIPNGFATMRIEEASVAVQTARQSHIEFDVPLDEGSYLFRVLQSPDYLTTTWSVTVSLKSALAPEILSISPESVTNDVAHLLTIRGANFQPGAEVTIDGISLSPVTRLDSATLEAMIPPGVAAGTYSVTVTNPDGKSVTLPDALLVALPRYYLYFPIAAENMK